jgi:hypothetical protein
MADNRNNTILYKANAYNPNGYNNGKCRMSIKSATGIYHIVIPETWLGDYNKNRIQDWIKFLNDTLFPCELEEIKEVTKRSIYLETNSNKEEELRGGLRKLLKHKEVVLADPKPKDTPHISSNGYYWSDATQVHSGGVIKDILYNTHRQDAPIYNRTVHIIRNHDGEGWEVTIGDFVMKDTNEPLNEVIDNFITEFYAKNKTKEAVVNAYFIKVDNDKMISNHHKLAVLAAIRYLWHPNYPDLVKNILEFVDQGVDPWTALYLGHSVKRYDPYWGLTAHFGFKPKEAVIKSLKEGNVINTSFSPEDGIYKPETIDKFRAAFRSGKSAKELFEILKQTTLSIKCTDDVGVSGLTKNKIYRAEEIKDAKGNVVSYKVLNNDDYMSPRYKTDRFEVVDVFSQSFNGADISETKRIEVCDSSKLPPAIEDQVYNGNDSEEVLTHKKKLPYDVLTRAREFLDSNISRSSRDIAINTTRSGRMSTGYDPFSSNTVTVSGCVGNTINGRTVISGDTLINLPTRAIATRSTLDVGRPYQPAITESGTEFFYYLDVPGVPGHEEYLQRMQQQEEQSRQSSSDHITEMIANITEDEIDEDEDFAAPFEDEDELYEEDEY